MMPEPTAPPTWDPKRVSARRSFGLMAAGAAVGLALAGYTLFTARSTTTLFVPTEDVALVNQQPISRAFEIPGCDPSIAGEEGCLKE